MNGANTVRVMLGAIWPSFLTLENHIPKSQGIATNTMISFFLFWLAQIPFLYMHPNNLRWLFMAKTIIVPIAWIAILIWAFVAEGGGNLLSQRTTISGSAYSWVHVSLTILHSQSLTPSGLPLFSHLRNRQLRNSLSEPS
jgi:NCS1 family nucleobase:cation symporter-1